MKNEKTIPEEDIEYVKVSSDLKQWVEDVTRSGDAPRYNYSGWPSDLWDRTPIEIASYLERRFYETTDVQEYYRCMLYLTKRIDAKELFVPWEKSPNYKAIMAEINRQNGQGGINIAPKKVEPLTMGKMNRLGTKQTGKKNFNTLKKSTLRIVR